MTYLRGPNTHLWGWGRGGVGDGAGGWHGTWGGVGDGAGGGHGPGTGWQEGDGTGQSRDGDMEQGRHPALPVNRLTDRNEHITFLQTTCAGGKNNTTQLCFM